MEAHRYTARIAYTSVQCVAFSQEVSRKLTRASSTRRASSRSYHSYPSADRSCELRAAHLVCCTPPRLVSSSALVGDSRPPLQSVFAAACRGDPSSSSRRDGVQVGRARPRARRCHSTRVRGRGDLWRVRHSCEALRGTLAARASARASASRWPRWSRWSRRSVAPSVGGRRGSSEDLHGALSDHAHDAVAF